MITDNLTRISWIRPLAVIAVLLLSVLLPFFATVGQLQLVAALVVGLAGALVLLQRPQLGLLLVFVGGMFLPTIGPSGLNVPLVMVAGLLGLWLVDSIIRKGEIRLVSSRIVTPLLVFIAISILAFIVGQLPWFSFARNAPMDAQLGGLALFVLAACTVLLVAVQVKDIAWLQWFTWAFLALSGVYILGRLVPVVGQYTRYFFTNQSIGGIFWACMPAAALSQALFNRDLKLGWRLLLGLLVVGAVYIAYVHNYRWKSGWIPALTGVAVLIWLRSPRAGLLIIIGGALVGLRLLPELLASDSYSVSTRFDAWIIMAEIVKVSPLIGMGFGNYYWYTPLFGIRGFDVSFNSHNNYVDIIAQTGLVGLLCLGWIFFEAARLGWRLRSRVPEGFPQAYVNGVLAMLAATLVAAMLGDWLLPFVYNIGLSGFRTGVLFWFFLGGLLVIEKLYAPADEN